MWILPSQLSKCAPGMAALDLESKTSLASDCEPSHIVSLRGSLKPISSVRWKKDSWMQHLFGAILKPSHTNLFTDWWTSSLRDTLVSHSLPLESEPVKKTQDICGLGLQTEFDFFSQQCVSLKMSKDTSRWDSPQSSVIWKNWVTKCRGEYSLRVKLAHLTSANDSSSWPTAAARDYKGESGAGRQERKGNPADTLPNAVAQWPTPAVMDTTGGSYMTEWKDGRAVSYHNHTQENPVAYGAKLSDAVKSGPADPANPSTLGSRQGLSEPSQQNWQTFAHGTHNRGETPHRQVVRALVHGDKAKTQCLTVDQVFAEEIKGTNQRQESWRTPSSSDGEGGVMEMRKGCAGKYKLRDHVAAVQKQWATPRLGGEEKAETRLARGKDIGLHGQVGAMTNSAKLNPRWVEVLMGLPVGWTMPSCKSPVTIELTNCASSATESCQQQQPELL